MKKLSNELTQYNIKGMLLPFNPFSRKPVFLEVNGKFLLPIFSTKDKFDEAAKWAGFAFAKCSIIVDPEDFKKSVLQYKQKSNFHVVADPYVTEEGNTRFQLIPFDEQESAYGQES